MLLFFGACACVCFFNIILPNAAIIRRPYFLNSPSSCKINLRDKIRYKNKEKEMFMVSVFCAQLKCL